jgi:hypothetical protein
MPGRTNTSARHGDRHNTTVLWMLALGTLCSVLIPVGLGCRAIQALDARGRIQHERMLEDTQSLADESGSLVQENAARLADIAALTQELEALRAEVAALRRARR